MAGNGSSRVDLVIQENNKNNSQANNSNYYIGDIKTGKTTVQGTTYLLDQMNQNQDNILGTTTNYQNIPGVMHWQFNPGKSNPQQKFFKGVFYGK